MTIREDVRGHFARQAVSHPAPPGLRARTLAVARRGRAVERRTPQWIMGAVAILVTLAIVAGLLAASALRHRSIGPAPAASPSPVHKTALLFNDNLQGSPEGWPYLHPAPLSAPGTRPSAVVSFQLAASLPQAPAQGTIYGLDNSLGPSAVAIANAWGLRLPSTQSVDELIQLDQGPVQIFYSRSAGSLALYQPASLWLRPSEPITDSASAIRSASSVLVRLGLITNPETTTMAAEAAPDPDSGSPTLWSIQILRMVGGVPVHPGFALTIRATGDVESVVVTRSTISGSEPVRLIDAASAWRQVSEGHWYQLAWGAAAPMGSRTGQTTTPFRADLVELCYYDTGGNWLIPMWCFRDQTSHGAANPLWIFYPAAAPGSFIDATVAETSGH